MSWYYAENGKQVGPITEAEFESLVQRGTVRDHTLVWKEGMANWQAYSQVRSPAQPALGAPPPVAPAAGPAAGEVVCVECGRTFTQDNAIQYGTSWVCATCKPVFVQRLREGAPIPSAGVSAITEAQVLDREYRIELGDCLERAWKIFSTNAGLILGTSLVLGLVAVACWIASALLSLGFPPVNALLSLVYTGPLVGGYLWFFLRLVRGEPASMGDAFAGFSRRGLQLILCSLVQGLLSLACLSPLIILGSVFGFIAFLRRGNAPNLPGSLLGMIALLGLVGIAGLVYLSTLWTHSLLLIVDKGYSFWPAMQLSRKLVTKRWWMTFLFLVVAGMISSAGAIACLIGLLVTIPLYYGMKVCLYDDNFRELARAS